MAYLSLENLLGNLLFIQNDNTFLFDKPVDRYKIYEEDYLSLKTNNIMVNSNLQNCAVAASSIVINYAAFIFQLSAKFVRSLTIHYHFCYLQPWPLIFLPN